jgi:PAS domain S-box-containing protein
LIRILFVEDTPQDMDLTLRSLRKAGLEIESRRVASLDLLKDALLQPWDIILSDFNLPGFGAIDVLKTVRLQNVQTPIIVISGAVRDEDAVALMRHGAADFVRKDNDARLAPAILREIEIAVDKKQSIEILEASEQQFRTLADSIPQLAWMAKGDGAIFWFNQKWYDYTGTSFSEVEGWGWEKVLNPEFLSKILPKWKAALERGTPWEDVFQLKSRTGEYRRFLSRALPIRDSQARITGWFGTNTDVNDQFKIEEELKAAKAIAEDASLAKTRFLANMSHEIRTPLGVMIGFADLALEQAPSSTETLRYLSAIKRNGEMLTRILGEVLDLSKIEASRIEIEQVRFSLHDLLEEVIAFLGLNASEKGIALSLKKVDPLPSFLKTDPTRLRQVLNNLISNAIKFTEQGEVVVTVEVLREIPHASGGMLQFSIQDTGIGISLEQRKKLFQPFSQADPSMTRRYGGSGLGLILARELARALGGDILIQQSALGAGTTFVCTVAVSDIEEAFLREPVLERHLKTESDLSGIHILLVEDSRDNQIIFQRFLQKSGAQVDIAENGKIGVEKALSADYDLLLMDIQMPVKNGHEAVIELRKSGYNKPIVALTAHALREEKERAASEGFTDYLTKPLDRDTLLKTVERIAKKRPSLGD